MRQSSPPRCLFLGIALLTLLACDSGPESGPAPITLVLHGGAGTILRENMSAESERLHREALEIALRTGYEVLEGDGSALDAVEATVRYMEDSPLFNAGRGAVFSAAGLNELDASIMDGATGRAGAVAAARTVRHPVSAARKVMEETRHVMLAERGADLFAAQQGLEIVEPEFFHTDRRWDALLRAQQREGDQQRGGAKLHDDPAPAPDDRRPESEASSGEDEKHGTVGVLALDRAGNLAAATSTGGLTNKMRGRVGDVPIIGAGTFADNATCAVSATGVGEYYMRALISYDVAARMRYTGASLEQAVEGAMRAGLYDRGGDGGLIALDAEGNVAMEFNTPGMYRGYLREGEDPVVMLYGEE